MYAVAGGSAQAATVLVSKGRGLLVWSQDARQSRYEREAEQARQQMAIYEGAKLFGNLVRVASLLTFVRVWPQLKRRRWRVGTREVMLGTHCSIPFEFRAPGGVGLLTAWHAWFSVQHRIATLKAEKVLDAWIAEEIRRAASAAKRFYVPSAAENALIDNVRASLRRGVYCMLTSAGCRR